MTSAGSYNLKVGRKGAIVPELRALGGMVEILTGMEAESYPTLPPLPGKRVVRSKATEGRSSLFAYVDRSLGEYRVKYDDLQQTWRRPKYPHMGPHPARSIMILTFEDLCAVTLFGRKFGGLRVVVGHAPQVAEGTGPAREEWLQAMTVALAPWKRKGWKNRAKVWRQAGRLRPVLALLDANGLGAELARRTGCTLSGTSVETALHRRLKVRKVTRVRHIGKQMLESDHPALVVTW